VVIAFLCALQYFYHTPPSPAPDSARVASARSATPPFMRPSPTLSIDTALANEVASASGSPRAASPRSPGAVTSRPVSPTGHAVIDNTRALRPAVDSFMVRIPTPTSRHRLLPPLIYITVTRFPLACSQEVVYYGRIPSRRMTADSTDDNASLRSDRAYSSDLPSFFTHYSLARRQLRCSIVKQLLIELYEGLHAGARALLATATAFSFELCVLYSVVATLLHADLVSLLYMGFFLLLTTQPRALLHRRWRLVVHGLALLVLIEYLVVLRLPPHLEDPKSPLARVMGSRQCSLFARFADAEVRSFPYSYGQWLGVCISDQRLLVVDFVMLLLAIIQGKRFKAGAWTTLHLNTLSARGHAPRRL
jgi:hypothetical protein